MICYDVRKINNVRVYSSSVKLKVLFINAYDIVSI